MDKQSVFNTSEWLNTLRRTYGNRIFEVRGLPVMEIRIPFIGRKGVSLPYSDFFNAPVETGTWEEILRDVRTLAIEKNWKYFEYRGSALRSLENSIFHTYKIHTIDLTRPLNQIEGDYRKRALRKIQSGKKYALNTEITTEKSAVRRYYRLHCSTRKRQGVPPQPFRFFKNIQRELIQGQMGFYAFASHGGKDLAGQVYLLAGQQAIYKFGASSKKGRKISASYHLMGDSIKYLKEQGASSLSLGRTATDNKGLLQFKDSWGARKDDLIYTRIYYTPRIKINKEK